MTDQNDDLPKVPPFVIKGTSGNTSQEPANMSRRVNQVPAKKNGQPSERGMLSIAVLLISVVSLGIAMFSGAYFAYDILAKDSKDNKQEQSAQGQNNIQENSQETEGDNQAEEPNKYKGAFAKIIVVGLAYLVGWLFTAFGIRTLGNLVLPIIINIYAWIVLVGVLSLQIAIISKLFAQAYGLASFIRYLSLFAAGMLAMIGLHLVLENHSLVIFAIPILLTSLVHLFLTVFHFVFIPDVNYGKLWGDLIFFGITTTTSILMLAPLRHPKRILGA